MAASDERQTVAVNDAGVPVLKAHPTRVYEAGLAALRCKRVVADFRRRRQAILELEAALAQAVHGEKAVVRRHIAARYGWSGEHLGRLHRWFRAGGEAALVPGWGSNEGSRVIPRALQAELKAQYSLTTQPSVAQCHVYAIRWCLARGILRIPSYSTILRYIDGLPNKGLIAATRKGRKAWKDTVEFVIRRDPEAIPVNTCWVADHREMDTRVVSPTGKLCRPWLTLFADVTSGAFVGWTLREQVSSEGAAQAFRRGVLGFTVPDLVEGGELRFPALGLPSHLYLDWGREFHGGAMRDWDAEHHETIFNTLGVRKVKAIKYQPRSKPIEPMFGAFASRVENLIAGWTGRNAKERPEGLQVLEDRGNVLSWWQYESVVAREFARWNIERPVGNQRTRVPYAYYADHEPTIPPAEQLDTLLMRATSRKLTNQGITIGTGRNARHYMCDDAMFLALSQDEVEIRYSQDDQAAIIAIDPATGRRWECRLVELGSASWRLMLDPDAEAPEPFRFAQGIRGKQKLINAAYRAWVVQTVSPELADPTGSQQMAVQNGREIRALRRLLARPPEGETDPATEQPSTLRHAAANRRETDDNYLLALARRNREEEARIRRLGEPEPTQEAAQCQAAREPRSGSRPSA